MKNSISFFLLTSIFLLIGCTASKKTMDKESQEIVYYYIKAKAVEGATYETLIDDKFKELENLDLRFLKIHYNKKDAIKYECEIEILFDNLTINDKEYSNSKHFSKVVDGQQVQSEEEGSTTYSETIRGYVYQRIKERKLNWDIIVKINTDSNNCKIANNSFTESFISKSVDNTLSGDERAISKKYKESIGQPLLNIRDMKKEAITSVYNKIEDQLKRNH